MYIVPIPKQLKDKGINIVYTCNFFYLKRTIALLKQVLTGFKG